jgi:hypothetical protein
VSFFSIFVVLFGTFAMVLGLVQLIGSHPGLSDTGSQHPVGDSVTRVVVLGAVIVVIAALLLVTSLRRGLRFSELAQGFPSPVARVAQSYAAAVSFAAVVIGAVSLAIFGYQVCRILAPGVFELSGSRVDAARVLLSALYLVFASAGIIAFHSRLLPHRGWSRLGADDVGQVPPPPPVL